MTGSVATWQSRCESDAQIQVLARQADTTFLVRAGGQPTLVAARRGEVRVVAEVGFNETWDFTITLPAEAWERFTKPAPPPQYTTLQAMLGRVDGVAVEGSRLKWAQHSALVERVLALARSGEPRRNDGNALTQRLLADEEIVGRYRRVDVRGQAFRVYYETAGSGPIPLVLLHTAGSDSRQYKYLLIDENLRRKSTLYAFDMPWHGRTEPPADWLDRKYDLTIDFYSDTINAFVAALGLDRPIVLGCSMGGAIVLYLASVYGERYRACIAAEGGFGNPSRRVDWANHPAVNETHFVPSWVSGLIAPTTSAQLRSEILWEYSQAGPGVYHGDCYFYAFEMPQIAKELGPTRCPLYVLSGEYDYSATPQMSEDAARHLGGQFVLMEQMGHFPMGEEPERFASYVSPILDEVSA